MSRISTPATIDAAPAASRPLLEGVKKQLGVVPNMFRLIANSPGALESYLGLSAALNKGALPAATRERIALAVAEVNGCNYCLSAHTYLGKNLAKLDDAEIAANRNGASSDPKADAAIRFAVKVVRERGPSAKACTRQQRLDLAARRGLRDGVRPKRIRGRSSISRRRPAADFAGLHHGSSRAPALERYSELVSGC